MSRTPRTIIETLNAQCSTAVERTFADGREPAFASRYVLFDEISAWATVLEGRKEAFLVEAALREYAAALLNLAQGQYRGSYKALRATLELCLQAVFLSLDEIALREWLSGVGMTRWASIIGEDGIFGARFRKVFFPGMDDTFADFNNLAAVTYRELSQHVHGNVSSHVDLPKEITFDEDSFATWIKLAGSVQQTIHFCLSSRYLRDLGSENIGVLADMIRESIGHIELIRVELGAGA